MNKPTGAGRLPTRIAWAVLSVLVVGGLAVGYRLTEANRRSGSMFYSLQARYQALPPSDEELAGWLRGRPAAGSVTVDREGSMVSLRFEQADPQPTDPLGAVLRQAGALGYRGRTGYSGRFGRRRAYDFQTLRIEFDSMPPDDGPLRAWLDSHPALIRSSVAREGNFLSVEFALKEPPAATMLGDILERAGSLGYGKREGYLSGFGPYR